MPPATIERERRHPQLRDRRQAGARLIRDRQLGHDHERRDLHQPGDAGAVDEALHQLLDHRRVRPRLLQLEEHRDVRRLEQAERDHGHHADDDDSSRRPSRGGGSSSGRCRAWSPSCQPAASVIVTTVGMISTIFGISLVVNSTRAGTDSRPMIGPSTNPRKRSMIVQAAPPATWRNSSGHSLSAAIAAITSTARSPTSDQALARARSRTPGARSRPVVGALLPLERKLLCPPWRETLAAAPSDS